MFDQFKDSISKLWDKLSSWLDSIVLALPNIVLAAIVLAISIYLSRYLKKLVTKGLRKTTNNKTVTGLISNVAVAAFMIIAMFVVLNILNLSEAVTALLGTAGVIGLAIGLALQDPLTNLFSGILMSVREYYKIGDLVETNSYFGKIQRITLRSTVLEEPDGQIVIIPNKDIIQNPIRNYSNPARRRVEVSCGVSYGDDLKSAKEIAINAVKNSTLKIADNYPIELYFHEFGDSSINFKLRFWQDIVTATEYLKAQDIAVIAIKEAFDKNDITIPFPITTLDFGIVGGLGIKDIYPPAQMKALSNSENGETDTKTKKEEPK